MCAKACDVVGLLSQLLNSQEDAESWSDVVDDDAFGDFLLRVANNQQFHQWRQ